MLFYFYILEAYRDESVYEPTVSIEDLQKKIIPWHVLLPSRDDVEDTSEVIKNRKINNQTHGQGLILVATLVDKGTNLGGISRTCEIFNVKELVGKLFIEIFFVWLSFGQFII